MRAVGYRLPREPESLDPTFRDWQGCSLGSRARKWGQNAGIRAKN